MMDADIVIAGGRGLKTRQNFEKLSALANVLKADVGGTRGALDMGWITHAQEIGMSGHKIRPWLYIGIGISGSDFHVMGMKQAEVKVAVNLDVRCHMVEIADIAVIQDAGQFVDAFTEYLTTVSRSGQDAIEREDIIDYLCRKDYYQGKRYLAAGQKE